MKKLAYVIPLGTLLVLAVAFAIARWRHQPVFVEPVRAAPETHLPPLDFPERSGRIAGRITNAGGAPVAGAALWLRVGSELAYGESGPEGAFEFAAVQSGPRVMNAYAEGFVPQRFDFEESDATPTLVLARAMPQAPAFPPMKRARLAGRIEANAGDLTGFQVVLAPRAPPEALGGPVPVRTECAADGAFEFDGLIEGEYTVQLLPRWAANGSWPDLLRPLTETTPRPLDHSAAASANGVVLRSLAGAITGHVRDSAGGPLEGALILVSRAGVPSKLWPPVASSADGGFTCLDLPPGRYTLALRAGGDALMVEVDVVAGETRELTDLRPLDVARPR